jgi:hypothetical protein
VKVELEDEDVVVVEKALELVDVFEPPVRNVAGDEFVDARREDVFVVRTVEDADHAAWRDLGMDAPEEVVTGFEWSGDLEGGDVAALGVDAGEDVADGSVFTRGVHALQDDEQGFGLTGVEDILKLIEPVAMLDQDRLGRLFGFEVACIGGRYFGKPDFGVRLNEKRRLNFHEARLIGPRLQCGVDLVREDGLLR